MGNNSFLTNKIEVTFEEILKGKLSVRGSLPIEVLGKFSAYYENKDKNNVVSYYVGDRCQIYDINEYRVVLLKGVGISIYKFYKYMVNEFEVSNEQCSFWVLSQLENFLDIHNYTDKIIIAEKIRVDEHPSLEEEENIFKIIGEELEKKAYLFPGIESAFLLANIGILPSCLEKWDKGDYINREYNEKKKKYYITSDGSWYEDIGKVYIENRITIDLEEKSIFLNHYKFDEHQDYDYDNPDYFYDYTSKIEYKYFPNTYKFILSFIGVPSVISVTTIKAY